MCSSQNDPDLQEVITDFLEMGHAANIAAMFRQDTTLYSLVGDLLRDERFMVRLGVAVLFEELVETSPREVGLAVPALIPLLADETAWVRGEAANILGIIHTPESLSYLEKMPADPDPQVREIIAEFCQKKDQ